MPANVRKNKGYYLELPEDVVARLDALAKDMGRTRTAEILHAIERHLAAPPVVIEPSLPRAEVEKPTIPPKRRGRPIKSAAKAADGEGASPAKRKA